MRERMVKLAIADTPYFLYSDFELRRKAGFTNLEHRIDVHSQAF